MNFISPALLILFAVAFLGVWFFIDQDRRYLLKLGTGFFMFGVAFLCQLVILASGSGPTIIISAILYTAGALVLSDGILMRSHQRFPRIVGIMWFVTLVSLIVYFCYVDRNLVARVYVLNMGLGMIFLNLIWVAKFLRHGEKADRILFWVLVIFTSHFFLRTFLTVNSVTGDLQSFGTSSYWIWLQVSSSIIGAGFGIGLLAVTNADMMLGLKRERDSDALTGLLNRRGLENKIPAILEKSRVSDVSIVVCDVDFFKKINDTYGHATGDAVLMHVARLIANAVEASDFVARVGGEEFVIVLCNRSPSDAYAFTEQLRKTIQGTRFEDVSFVRSVTCSFGMAQYQSHEDFWRAVARADRTLYDAKKAGRNQTLAAGGQVPGVA